MQLAGMSPEKQAATEAAHTRMMAEKYKFEEFKKAEKQAAEEKKAAEKAAKAAAKPKKGSRPKPGLSQATLLAQQTQAEPTEAEQTQAEMAVVQQQRKADADMVRVISHGCLFRLKPSPIQPLIWDNSNAIQNAIQKVKMHFKKLK